MIEQENNYSIMKNWIDISYFTITNKGGRLYNEDYYGHACHGNTVTFIVSDGVGSQAGGSIASEIVVETIRQHAGSLDRNEMLESYQIIEKKILSQQQHPKYRKMGATMAELRIDPVRQMAIWGHFGDSRIYWIRNYQIMSVTHDHSIVQNLVTAGLISKQQALTHPRKHVLLGAFGMAENVAPEVIKVPVYLVNGDAFLLCTDGLWNCISDQEILELLQTSATVEEWTQKLGARVKTALPSDKDNYTATGVWITHATDRTVQMSRSQIGNLL